MKGVHKVCYYIRKHDAARSQTLAAMDRKIKCKECPAWETDPVHGNVKNGCRMQAEEIINVVRYGNPWGRKYRKSRSSWPDRSKFTTGEPSK